MAGLLTCKPCMDREGKRRARLQQCIAACEGIEDPEAAMRAARETLERVMRSAVVLGDGSCKCGAEWNQLYGLVRAALAALGGEAKP